MKEKEVVVYRTPPAVWIGLGLIIAFVVVGLWQGWFFPSSTSQAAPVAPVYQQPEANAAAETSVDEMQAEPEANAEAASDTNNTTGSLGGGGDDTSLTDANALGNVTSVTADNVTFNETNNYAASEATTDQTAASEAVAEANANNSTGTALMPCEKHNTVGSGPVAYQVVEFESQSQPIKPSEMTAELAETYANENRSHELASRPAQQSCFLTEEAVAERDCAFGYQYVRFRPETGLAGWFWLGNMPNGINANNTISSCN